MDNTIKVGNVVLNEAMSVTLSEWQESENSLLDLDIESISEMVLFITQRLLDLFDEEHMEELRDLMAVVMGLLDLKDRLTTLKKPT